MPIVIPFVPRTITVHMGPPDEWAENVTVNFPEYVKNVASSEIYPTWEPAAIRANVLNIISFALNRVYTEFYPSRGYDFQITSITAYDQKFIRGRNIFENISWVVDDIFNDYIRREGFVEPLSAKFCNGTTATCGGLSQWGSQGLAQDGYNSMEILYHYYGDDIELVVNAPIQDITASYPGKALQLGDIGREVVAMQTMLNRIAQNYPAIPKISPVVGAFDDNTEQAVKEFQHIFNLTPDGVVGKATWYKLVYLYVGVNDLAELVSQGQTMHRIQFQFPGTLREGDTGSGVQVLQYMIDLLAEYDNALSPTKIDGVFGSSTARAVRNYQGVAGLTVDGVVDAETWKSIYRHFVMAEQDLKRDMNQFSRTATQAVPAAMMEVGSGTAGYANTVRLGQYPGQEMKLGRTDQREVVPI